jgi:hypothetical protein
MAMYHNHFLFNDHSFCDDISLLIHLKNKHKYDLYSLSCERLVNIVKLDWPNVLVRGVRIIHSIHGIHHENDHPYRVGDFSFGMLRVISFNGTLCLEYSNILKFCV